MIPRPAGRDVHAELLAWLMVRGGDGCAVLASRRKAWASATFIGERHQVTLAAAGEAADRLVEGIDEAEAPLRGHLLADIVVAACADGQVVLDALTIENRS